MDASCVVRSMKITNVNVKLTSNKDKSPYRGNASITIDDCFVVHRISIIEKADRLLIGMPSWRSMDGDYHDYAHPINTETRRMIEEAIIVEYNKAVRDAGAATC